METFWKKGDIVIMKKPGSVPPPSGDDAFYTSVFEKGVEIIQAFSRNVVVESCGRRYTFRYSDIERCINPEKELERQKYYEKIYAGRIYNIDEVRRLAESVFGEERVWVYGDNSSRFDIKIYFPELNITNSEDKQHTIRDLYVKFEVDNIDPCAIDTNICSISFKGDKQTFTLEEYSSDYVHSHLPSMRRNSLGYKQFCLGGSTFGQILVDVSMNMTEDSWMMLFLSLENYLKWESLEGGPYIRMKNISMKNATISPHDIKLELIKSVENLPTNIWDFTRRNRPEIIKNSKVLYDYLDKVFEIRSLNAAYSEHYIEKLKTNANRYLSKSSIKWKKTARKRNIIYNPVVKDEEHKKLPLSINVVHAVEKILDKHIITHVNNIRNEKSRKERGKIVFPSETCCSLR